MTAWPLSETWSRWLAASGDLSFVTLGNFASVVVTSLIAARKAGSADVDVLDWIRTISPCSSFFVLKPAEMILSAFRASPTLVSFVFRYFVPTMFPTATEATTKTSQPTSAVFQ